MKRALAIALAALCAAPAAYGWHCSALNRDYPLPVVTDEEVPAANLTMATKEGIVAAGSGLEWITNVALFAHGRNPTNYAKLVNHTLNTKLLPKAYHDWMFGQVRDIFTRHWGGTYSDGSSNTVEVLGLHYGSPFDVGSDDYDFQETDLRHNFSSGSIWNFSAEPGNSPLTVAASNSVRRVLGRNPAVYRPGPYNLDIDVGASTFPYSWSLVQNGLSPGYADLKYILNAGTPAYTVYATTPLKYVNLGFRFHGPSPLSVESKHRRYTTHTKFTVTIETNADYTATMSFTHEGYGVAESTNIEHTVARKTLGQTAAAKSEAFGYPWSVSARSPTKVFLRGDPVSHVFSIDGTAVSAYCIPLWYAWASNMTYEVDLPYVLDYTLSRIRADEPPGRSHYPPALAGSDIYHQFSTRAWTPFKAVADGCDYDGYTYYVDETITGGLWSGVDNGRTGDAMALVCAKAAAITNACAAVTFNMYAEDGAGWLLPQITYDEVQNDATIAAMPMLSNGYHQVFAAYRADNSEYLGWCTTNNWALNVRHIIDHGPAMVFEHQPTYQEADGRPVYDVYHGDYPWSLELKVDMDAYGSWEFNNWLR